MIELLTDDEEILGAQKKITTFPAINFTYRSLRFGRLLKTPSGREVIAL